MHPNIHLRIRNGVLRQYHNVRIMVFAMDPNQIQNQELPIPGFVQPNALQQNNNQVAQVPVAGNIAPIVPPAVQNMQVPIVVPQNVVRSVPMGPRTQPCNNLNQMGQIRHRRSSFLHRLNYRRIICIICHRFTITNNDLVVCSRCIRRLNNQ